MLPKPASHGCDRRFEPLSERLAAWLDIATTIL
jgi:hypothetical protein